MPELVSRTVRIWRGWVERLRGFDRVYQTNVTDGYRVATGRGATSYASGQAAQRTSERTHATEMSEYDLPSPTSSIAVNAGDSTSLGEFREVIDALRADNGKLLRLLIKRFANNGRPEHRKLAEMLVHHPNLRHMVGQ
jgi:hypothetical protein